MLSHGSHFQFCKSSTTLILVHATLFASYSRNLDFSVDLFSEEQESDLLSSEDDEIPFARHGPIVDLDQEEIAIQCNCWNLCAIGFLLDYKKFSVSHLQHIIDHAWTISIVGRESNFYVFHFEFEKDLLHI